MKSILSVSQAEARLSRVVNAEEIVGIQKHNEIRGYYVPRERLEALLETMELLANPKCLAAVEKFEAGKMRFTDWRQAKRELAT